MKPITTKVFRDLAREKTFVAALVLQFLLVISMSILLSYTTLYFNPDVALDRPVRVGYQTRTPFILFLENETVDLIHLPHDGMRYFNSSAIDVYLEERREGDTVFLDIYVPDNQAKSMMYLSKLKDALSKYDATLQETVYPNKYRIPLSNIDTRRPIMKGVDITYEILYGYLIPFILLIPIFLVGTLLIDIVSEEYERKTLSLLLTTTSKIDYLIQIIVAGLAIIGLQVLLWVLLMFLRGMYLHNLPYLLLYLTLFSTAVLLFALIIGILFKNKAQSQLVYSLIVVIITSLTNVTLFAPVNSIVNIIIGIETTPIMLFVIPALIVGVEAFVLSRMRI